MDDPKTSEENTEMVHVSTAQQWGMKDIGAMAAAISKSGLFGIDKHEDAVSLMLIAQAEGKHPAQACREYHIIKGRAALNSDAMLARHQASGGTVKWITLTDDLVVGEFYHPAGGTATIKWDDAMVTKAGLNKPSRNGEPSNHVKYPRAMKRSRCTSEGVRTVNPGAIFGFYTPEEVESFTSQAAPAAHVEVVTDEDGKIADVHEVEVVAEPVAEVEPEEPTEPVKAAPKKRAPRKAKPEKQQAAPVDDKTPRLTDELVAALLVHFNRHRGVNFEEAYSALTKMMLDNVLKIIGDPKHDHHIAGLKPADANYRHFPLKLAEQSLVSLRDQESAACWSEDNPAPKSADAVQWLIERELGPHVEGDSVSA